MQVWKPLKFVSVVNSFGLDIVYDGKTFDMTKDNFYLAIPLPGRSKVSDRLLV